MGNGLDVVASELARDVEEFRRAEAQLRRRLAAARQPNETDRSAMRIIASAPVDSPVTPSELAAQLGVSTAAVTSVVRRLAERGQVVVAVHPDDARSKIIRPSLRDLHSPADEISRRIERVEREFAPEQLAAISLFLRRLARELEGIE
ncbi:MarR family winged helix-turn-helix transcriptional regulator [Microbacterium oxydans]|uniref:MarR family winged helix-turn-helix transcriptional regulator n=1 Tax=Microbacterium oxydans TaxID=82380 RepID=UPI0022B21B9D|nr:MarR family transcriptional regulator [Microbacterium oxydans]MCZ4302171.1 MarR family transcriptional regulator [Microbacterium oxydans]